MGRYAFLPVLLAVAAAAAAAAAAQNYDHLTIVPDSLAATIAPLCARVESRGMSDTTVTVEDALASSSGRDNQEKLRNFIKRAYGDWGVTHILLAGDNDQIPCRLCWVEINSSYRDWIPTELYYSALEGDWDRDADNRFGEPEDSVDLCPDVLLGRLPLATRAELQHFVDRYLVYTADSTAPYLGDALFAGFDYSPGFCGEEACEFYDTLLRPASVRAVKVYDSHSGNHEDSVKHVLDRGVHVWVQYDHCNWFGMGCGYTNHGYIMYNNELALMHNAPDYSINLSGGCLPSAFDSATCVAEVLLAAPNGGCVATLGNTRLGFGLNPEPLRTGSHYYCEKALEGLWPGSGNGSFAGLVAGQVQAAPLAETNVVWRWCHYQFLLSGEPSMPVWMPASSGVAERNAPGASRFTPMPTIVRGVLGLPGLGTRSQLPGNWVMSRAALLDAAGRRVLSLKAGPNDVSRLSPGIYFVVNYRQTAAARVVVAR
jgi:hypothetical protein